uniref:Uncharacterized protein n=1 Tax=Oryza nivara TaxID=4536 RepID=A0A0E0IC04_ORYNI
MRLSHAGTESAVHAARLGEALGDAGGASRDVGCRGGGEAALPGAGRHLRQADEARVREMLKMHATSIPLLFFPS